MVLLQTVQKYLPSFCKANPPAPEPVDKKIQDDFLCFDEIFVDFLCFHEIFVDILCFNDFFSTRNPG